MAEQQRAAVVAAVGREVEGVPVGLDRWRAVREQAAWLLQGQPSGVVFTRDALGHGEWEGRAEESVTVAGEVDAAAVARLLEAAESLRRGHQQDAVAVTVGVTVLVGSPEERLEVRLSTRLRALAEALEEEGL